MAFTSISEWSTTAASNTEINGISLAEGVMLPSAVNNSFRESMAQVAAYTRKGSDLATASTLDLDSIDSLWLNLTGTTTVTAVTLTSGHVRMCRAAAAFTLTASASLIVNGSASVNYTTSADDLLWFEGYGSSVVRVWLVSSGGSVTTADISDMSANGRSLVTSADYAAMKALLDLEIGTDVQAYDADLTSWAGVTRASGFDTFAATPSSANLKSLVTDETGSGGALVFATSPTISGPTFTRAKIETVYTITDGAAFAVDPTNGEIQFVTLGASRTPVPANWSAGQTVTLRVADGTAYTITWSGFPIVWKGGSAPTLATTGYTEVNIEYSGGVYRGVYVGDFAS